MEVTVTPLHAENAKKSMKNAEKTPKKPKNQWKTPKKMPKKPKNQFKKCQKMPNNAEKVTVTEVTNCTSVTVTPLL